MSESATDPYASHATFVPDTPVIWTASEGQVESAAC